MKSTLLFLIFLAFLSFSLSIRLRSSTDTETNRRSKIRKYKEGEPCEEKKKNCGSGLKCFPIVSKVGKTENIRIDWKCKATNYKVPVGGYCIYQRFGSQCTRDSTAYSSCKDIKTYGGWGGKKSKIGICQTKTKNEKLPEAALTRSNSVDTTPILDVPADVKLDEDEIEFVSDAFEEIQNLMQNRDAFAAGLMILQYFVDEDEIKNQDIKSRIIVPYLEKMRIDGRKCEDIEAELVFKGIHVVNTWSTQQRNEYIWMVNNNYISGLKGVMDKTLKIKGLADATSGTHAKIIGEFASNAEIAGGFIKAMVDLVVQTIVDKKLTNSMLAALSTNTNGESSAQAQAIFRKNGDSIELGEGFGIMPSNSICKELKVNAGLKYMTGVHKE